jgi:hypothetical protein
MKYYLATLQDMVLRVEHLHKCLTQENGEPAGVLNHVAIQQGQKQKTTTPIGLLHWKIVQAGKANENFFFPQMFLLRSGTTRVSTDTHHENTVE